MKITFCGATERVTGSNYLVESNKIKFLVDCGLFQGSIEAEKQNWDEFKYDASKIDFVIVTHSHIDHIGRLPLLYKRGFRGKIFSTRPTQEFAKLFLEDNCKILGELKDELGLDELYSLNDVAGVCQLFETFNYKKSFSFKDVKIKFYDAGHILGSAFVEIKLENKTIVFSGDLGNPPVPILKDTDFITEADYIIMESTYGNRIHEPFQDRQIRLERIIEEVIAKNGTLLIPAFAMERTQEIIYELNDLIENNKIAHIPIYIDSPLAIKATNVYNNFPEYFDLEARTNYMNGKKFFEFPDLHLVASRDESINIDNIPGPKIIIAGSGMSTGGRILYHEKRYLSDADTTLLIIGYQVKGTLGRALYDKLPNVNIMGENVEVNAKIEIIESYSAHADQPRLLYWLSKIKKPIKVFLVHGEKISEDALLHKIEEDEGIETVIPKYFETIEI